MTIYFKNGSYYCRFQINGERKHLCCNGAKNKQEAIQIENALKFKLMQEQNGVIPKEDKKIKLNTLYQLFENYSKENKKSYSRTDAYILIHLKKYFSPNLIAKDLKPSCFEKFKTQIKIDRNVADTTVNKYLFVLSKMYNLAISEGLIKSNPLEKVKKYKDKNYKIRFLTKEEENKLFIAINKFAPHIKNIVITALQTGMRKSEILNLKWSNVYFDKKYIELLETKSGKSRKIPISNKLMSLLLELNKTSNSEYVFINPDTLKPYKDIHKSFKTVLDEAGIKNFRFHDLRHTVATRLAESNIDLVVVKEILGHSKIETTMRYAHAVPEIKIKAIDVLDSY